MKMLRCVREGGGVAAGESGLKFCVYVRRESFVKGVGVKSACKTKGLTRFAEISAP